MGRRNAKLCALEYERIAKIHGKAIISLGKAVAFGVLQAWNACMLGAGSMWREYALQLELENEALKAELNAINTRANNIARISIGIKQRKLKKKVG